MRESRKQPPPTVSDLARDQLRRPAPELIGSDTIPLSRLDVLRDIGTTQRACFEITGPDGRLTTVLLGEHEVSLGRSAECEVVLPYNNISRRHARVFRRNEEYCLEDLGSTNGIYVNGVSITKCILRSNDQIQIGDAKLHFIEERARQTP